MEAFLFCIILILLYALNSTENAHSKTQKELIEIKREIPNLELYRKQVMSEADSYRIRKKEETDRICSLRIHEVEIASNQKWDETKRRINNALAQCQQQQDFTEKFIHSKISAFPEVATFLADMETAHDDVRVRQLKTKNRPAPKAAEEVKAVKKEKRELVKRNKALEWELRYLRRILPWLDEIEDSLMEPLNICEEYINPEYNANDDQSNDVDNAGYWLTPEEYRLLSTVEKNQRALNRYNSRHKTNEEIGRDYERYIGYLFEKEGYKVDYTGINYGLNDLGRDLICIRNGKTFVVQCKCWSNKKGKLIREKHINQIFGTTFKYYLEQRNKYRGDWFVFGHSDDLFSHEIIPMFVSTVPLSDTAYEFAKELGIEFKQIAFSEYPVIKCNINNKGEKIYHLPFDQMYDKTDVSKAGEFYAMTVAEAESKGFRRAKKWLGR